MTCCFALQDKVWVDGPDREPWEIYTVLADADTRPTHRRRRDVLHATPPSPRRAAADDRVDRDLARRATAEFVGTALLVAVVVGSGIAAQRLSPGDIGLQLLENSVATGAGLVALILAFGAVSGAHFNPVVTLADRILGGTSSRDAGVYVVAQVAGACVGAMVANVMFDLPAVDVSTHTRASGALWLGEAVAAFGLVLVILGVVRAGRRQRGGVRGRRLHRRRVLVHVVDELRQPGGDRRPHAQRHVRRHRARAASRCSSSCRCSARSPRSRSASTSSPGSPRAISSSPTTRRSPT